MKKLKRRPNGKGCATYLGDGRSKSWGAKITIGKDENGKNIYHFIDTFETELETLVCLENYHNQPFPLYIKEDKYNRIYTFPTNPYPLVPVKNPKNIVVKKIQKDNYTFKQLFEEFKQIRLPNKEEINLERQYHIKPKGKFAYHNSRGIITAYNNCKKLYDKVYKDLRTSDFQTFLNKCEKNYESLKQIVNLFNKLDEYALQEDIIIKSYAQHITLNNTKTTKKSKTPFTYEQVNYLWNINPKNKKEEFVRDFLLIALYTGGRAEELLFIYTANIFLDKNYFIGGLKTQAGKDRQIPIHPDIKPIFEKYYNPSNEFLFMRPNGTRVSYDCYLYHYRNNFIENHPFLNHHTAHDGRHSLRTELEKLNIKEIIINSIIGHSNDDVGKDVYTHISIEEKIEAIKLVTYKKKKNLYIFASNQ